MVVDVKTTEADVIVCYIFFLLADVIANQLVVDVKTTRLMLLPVIFSFYWLMLLPINLWQMLSAHGAA